MNRERFDVILTSNACPDVYPNNKLNDFTVDLPYCLKNAFRYDVYLREFSHPDDWNTGTTTLTVRDEATNSVYEVHCDDWGKMQTPEALNYFLKNRVGRSDRITFDYDSQTDKFTLLVKEGSSMSDETGVKVSLFDILGFDRRSFKGRNISYVAKYHADFNAGNSHVLITCDSVEKSVFNDALLPILGTAPVRRSFHGAGTVGVSYVDYTPKRLTESDLSRLRVRLLNDIGQPFPFKDKGRVWLRLEFIERKN